MNSLFKKNASSIFSFVLLSTHFISITLLATLITFIIYNSFVNPTHTKKGQLLQNPKAGGRIIIKKFAKRNNNAIRDINSNSLLSIIPPTKSKTLLPSKSKSFLSIKILYLQAIYSQYSGKTWGENATKCVFQL